MTKTGFPTFRKDQMPTDWSASELQNMSDAAMHFFNLRAGPGIRIQRNPSGTIVSAIPQEQVIAAAIVAGAEIQLFQIADFATNTYLPCIQLTGESSGGTINVAKPHDLRGVNFPFTNFYVINGAAWTCSNYTQAGNRRTATNGSVTETQVITKTYEPNDLILAVKLNEDITQLQQANEWFDLNVSGRNWARAFGT